MRLVRTAEKSSLAVGLDREEEVSVRASSVRAVLYVCHDHRLKRGIAVAGDDLHEAFDLRDEGNAVRVAHA